MRFAVRPGFAPGTHFHPKHGRTTIAQYLATSREKIFHGEVRRDSAAHYRLCRSLERPHFGRVTILATTTTQWHENATPADILNTIITRQQRRDVRSALAITKPPVIFSNANTSIYDRRTPQLVLFYNDCRQIQQHQFTTHGTKKQTEIWDTQTTKCCSVVMHIANF